MKVGIGQINTRLGDLQHNTRKVKEVIGELGKHADTIIFPELTLPGYPGNDLYENDAWIAEQDDHLQEIISTVQEAQHDLKVILGYIDQDNKSNHPGGGARKYNAAMVIGQKIHQTYRKQLLCDYDVFFESRQFIPGRRQVSFQAAQDTIGTLTICEDIWEKDYQYKPLTAMKLSNVDAIFNLSSSPFHDGKLTRRVELLQNLTKKYHKDIIYCNQVGGQDDIVFDGGSMIIDKSGRLIHLGKTGEEDVQLIDTNETHKDMLTEAHEASSDKYARIHEVITLGLKDYLNKTGLESVIIGVSGGVDSALTLYFLSQVLPPERITAVYMPSKHSTNSKDDAKQLAKNLGIDLQEREIQSRFENILSRHQQQYNKQPTGITYENIQARIRGDILMELSNMRPKSMVINNSNKTELLLGYGTLHGDLIGGYNLIGDLNKQEVYELAAYINQQNIDAPFPTSLLDKPPSAELNEGQVDPFDYQRISQAVDALGQGVSPQKVAEIYQISSTEVNALANKVHTSEHKRRQSMPIVKLKQRHMGRGRIYPVAK